MSNLIFSFNVVAPVFLVVAVGYFIKKLGLIDDKFVNAAVSFNFKVGLSTLIFKNIYVSNLSEAFNIKLVMFAFLAIAGTVAVLWLTIPLLIKNRQRASAMIHTIYRSNFVLLGIPLAINMFGQSNIASVTLLMPIAIPAYNFFAVAILTAFDEDSSKDKKEKIKSTINGIIKNPLIIGSILGILMPLLSIKLPVVIEKTIFDIASLGTPLALLTLGAQFNFTSAISNLKYSVIATFGRLVAVPFIVVTLGYLAGFRGYELGAIFILFSSPTAVSSYIMAKEMNSDYELTSDVVLLSTLFSVFTIFAGVYMLRSLGLI